MGMARKRRRKARLPHPGPRSPRRPLRRHPCRRRRRLRCEERTVRIITKRRSIDSLVMP